MAFSSASCAKKAAVQYRTPVFTASREAADWEEIHRIAVDHKVEVTARSGQRTRATFVSATGDAMVVRETSGERSIARADIIRVRVHDPGRRVRRGLIWTGVGIGAGVGVGFAVCPYCANEGHDPIYVGPGIAIGAGLGALGFLTSPYRTVYQTH